MSTINTIAGTSDFDTTLLSNSGWQILGYWKCNETSGTVLHDSSGNSFGQDLNLTGNRTLGRPNLIPTVSGGKSVLFQGTGTPGMGRTSSALVNASGTTNNNSYVLGAWVAPYTDYASTVSSTLATIMGILGKCELDFNIKLFSTKYVTSSNTYNLNPVGQNVSEITQPVVLSNPTPSDSYFVASSWNNGVVQIFVNGVLISTLTGAGGTDQTTTSSFAIGALYDRSQSFEGYIQNAFIAVPSGNSSTQIDSTVKQLYIAGTQSLSAPSTGSLPWSGTVNVYPWSTQILPSGTYSSVTLTNNSTRTVWLAFPGPGGGSAKINTGIPLYPQGGTFTANDFPCSGGLYALHNTYFGYATINVSVS